jgi:hypothetical protein
MLRLTRSTIGLSLVWICMFGGTVDAAETINACMNPAGHIRLLEPGSSCRREEQLIIWNVQGPQGAQGPQGPQGPAGTTGPEGRAADASSAGAVVDAFDAVVGQLVSRTDVLVRVGDERFFASVGRTGFVKGGALLYTTPACDGAVYSSIAVSPTALAHMAFVSATTAWVIDPSVTPVGAIPGQHNVYMRGIDANGAVGLCTLASFSNPLTLRGLKPVDVSSFGTPFRIQ